MKAPIVQFDKSMIYSLFIIQQLKVFGIIAGAVSQYLVGIQLFGNPLDHAGTPPPNLATGG